MRVTAGVYRGFCRPVALGAMAATLALTFWILFLPEAATLTLSAARAATLDLFRGWYMYVLLAFLVFCLGLVVLPVSGRLHLGPKDATPEYSNATWLSMMFCAGLGAGILIYAVAEPLSHLQTNPHLLMGQVLPGTEHAAATAVSYAILHWGLSAWACYAVLAMAIGLYSHRYGMPMTIRTALAPLLGRQYDRALGNLIDVFSIFAIIAGLATTLGYGVESLVSGLHAVTGWTRLVNADLVPRLDVKLIVLTIVAVVATGSVVSGLRRGIKWMSNASVLIFFGVLACFAAAGDSLGNLGRLGHALWLYLSELPGMATLVARPQPGPEGDRMALWQTDWTIFYWAWWIAFAPFVALFLARISRGRSLRVFVSGCLFAPVGICAVWFAMVGGAAIDVQLAAPAGQELTRLPVSAQISATIRAIAPEGLALAWNLSVTLLLLLLLITTMNAAVLAINTIAAAGDADQSIPLHILSWGGALTLIIGSLLAAGGTDAIRDAMILGALPFSVVIVGAMLSIAAALAFETRPIPASAKALTERD